ncbi:MAG: CPBP family intramembrane metalloprotease [Acetatifactor sp.]|nr:CPBP family intramembrane metalloprotease [Acetatifactor sp.]
MTAAKRIGWVGLSGLAFLAALGVQIISVVIVAIPYGIIKGMKAGREAAAQGQGLNVNDISSEIMGSMGDMMGIVLVVVGVLLLIVFIPWFYFGCGRQRITRESIRRTFSPKTLLMVLVIAVGLNYGINCLLQLIYTQAPQLLEDYIALMENSGLGVNVWTNAAAVILAPLGEELIFRGVAFYYARKAVSGMKNPRAAFWIANCIQALLFGIYHMNLVQGVYAFFIGLALGYLCQKYRSLIPGMLTHLVFNGMSAVLGDRIYTWIPESALWYVLVGAAGVVLVLIAMFLNGPAVSKNEQNIA